MFFVALVTVSTAKGEIIFVDDNANVGGNGRSWATAYKYLQDALDVVTSSDQIWVAAGIYKPDNDEAGNVTPGDREATFELINDVAIKGGYAGFGAPEPNARDIDAYETILSGGIGTMGDKSDNSYNVVTGSQTNAMAVLDGFTITAGNANGTAWPDGIGGGMFNYGGSPTLTNCTFNANSAQYGGGMYNNEGSPTVTNCTFSGNLAVWFAGGIYNYSSGPTLTSCTFKGNSAMNSGGAMYNFYSSPILTNCTFTGNFAVESCGGMWNTNDSNPTLTNCKFNGNSAVFGGGMRNENYSSPTLNNCTFSGNSATNRGAGIFNCQNSSVTLTNCILWGNTAPSAAQIYNHTSSAIVSYSTVQGGWSGIGNIDADPSFVDADGPDDVLGTEDDNLRLSANSNCIDAGDNTSVPADTADLDGDANTTELTPLDLDGLSRFRDDAATADTGNGTLPIVDMGAYEYQPASYTLLLSSTSGGTVTAPGEGLFEYDYGTIVQITAEDPDTYWQFLKWTGTAVNAGMVENPDANNTTVRMDGDYTLRAIFRLKPVLTVSSTDGGAVTAPGEGLFRYEWGTVVPIIAQAQAGYPCYEFVEWTGTAVDAGKVPEPCMPSTTVTMHEHYTLVANFVRLPAVFHVEPNATGPTHDGSTWADAFKYLQDALAVAEAGDQIWVVKGTYKPDQSWADPNGSGNRTATFQLISGVAIYGGFPAGGGTWEQRDQDAHKTILSGDLEGNDRDVNDLRELLNDPCRDENSYHVVTGSGTDATTVLDGFTITAGNNGDDHGFPFLPGYRTYKGGGMYNHYGRPRVTNCTFRDNSAIEGGGMYNTGGSPTMTSCTFTKNVAWCGGGMENLNHSSPITTNCTFRGNSADWGGGIYNENYSSPTITNCTFSGNSAANWGGGMSNTYYSSPTLTNCTFSGNYSVFGGAVDNYEYCSLKLSNCILWDNTANNGSQLAGANTSTLSVNYCNVQGGRLAINVDRSTTLHWGDGNIDDDPLFVDPDNPDTSQRDYHLRPDSPCIDVADNTALPPDNADLDGDANSTEPIPFDLDGHPRIIDDDCNDTEIVDMGAYEFNYVYMGDFNYQCDVDFEDFAILALAWLTEPGDEQWNRFCDISIPTDNSIDMLDLAVVVDNWLAGK